MTARTLGPPPAGLAAILNIWQGGHREAGTAPPPCSPTASIPCGLGRDCPPTTDGADRPWATLVRSYGRQGG